MGETARERFHRMQEEKANSVVLEQPRLSSDAGQSVSADTLRAALLLKRKVALADRMKALGLSVVLAELPDAHEDLLGLERACAESEAATGQ